MKKSQLTHCKKCSRPGRPRARGLCSKCYNSWHYKNNKEAYRSKFERWLGENKDYNSQRNKEWRNKNRDSVSRKTKERYWSNRGKLREQEKAWRITPNGMSKRAVNEQRRRARIRANCKKKNDVNIDIVKGEYKNCVYCGDESSLTIEHIVPVSAGGNNDLNNLAIACTTCNCSKQNKNILDWLNGRKPYNTNVILKYETWIREYEGN